MISRYDYMSESEVKDTDGERFPDPLSVTYNDVQLTSYPQHTQLTSKDLEKFWYFMVDAYGRTDLDDILLNINNVPYVGMLKPGDVLYLVSENDLEKFSTQKLVGQEDS